MNDWLIAQRLRMLLWAPMALGIGIALFFSLRVEPRIELLWGLVLLWPALRLVRILPEGLGFLALFCVLIVFGFGASIWRVHQVAAPVLGWPYYGQISGVVVKIDRSATDRPRLTLDQVSMPPISPARTPRLIRVSLPPEADIPPPNAHIQITAYIAPPSGPAEPRGFDFQRHAWFDRLGGVGYARQSPEVIGAAPNDYHAWLFGVRMRISSHLQSTMEAPFGGFAAAILVGDRSGVPKEALENLRDANLAHLLAISGLHMGLLVGVVFFVIRALAMMMPYTRDHVSGKKLAAGSAMLAGLCYLQLSGQAVATERAFIMVSVMMGAVLLDRPALSLRAVALAAVLILVLRPENLMEPGFQMSFSATAALIVVFRKLQMISIWSFGARWKRILWGVGSLMLSSLVAGMATAPFAAFHFNQLPHYGVVANTLSLPIMSLIIMPCAVVAVIGAPFGLAEYPLTLMGWGIAWILKTAEMIAGWDGAVSLLPQPHIWVFALMGFGLGWLVITLGRARAVGLAAMLVAMAFWGQAKRPDVLLSDNGRLLGVLGETGARKLNRARGNGFVAQIWSENDGLPFDQAKQAALFDDARDQITLWDSVYYEWVKEVTPVRLDQLCQRFQIVILPKIKTEPREDCIMVDERKLRDIGSLAIHHNSGDITWESAKDAVGSRYWNDWRLRKQRLVGAN